MPCTPHSCLLSPLPHNALWSSWSRGNISSQFKVSITLKWLIFRVKLKQCKQGQSSECSNHLHLTSQSFIARFLVIFAALTISPSTEFALFGLMEAWGAQAHLCASHHCSVDMRECDSVTRNVVFPSSVLVIWASWWPGPGHWGYPCQPDPDPSPGIKRIRN